MRCWHLGICAVLLVGLGMAADVPFVFSEDLTSIASYTSDEIEAISENSPGLTGVPKESPRSDGWDQEEVEARVEPLNPIVRHRAALLAEKYPGSHNIDQICSIFDYLRNGDDTIRGWSYINDPRGENYYEYANESLQLGEEGGFVAAGACDDFAILMSALVESIGGTSRVVIASHNNGDPGHAFAEIYLGQDNDQNGTVEDIIYWLMLRFDTDQIYTHVDIDTKDVWLNLDWQADHPGGPFIEADEYSVYYINDQYEKTPMEMRPRIRIPLGVRSD